MAKAKGPSPVVEKHEQVESVGASLSLGRTDALEPSEQPFFWLFLERYMSPHTRRAYAQDWKKFCGDCRVFFNLALDASGPEGLAHFSEETVLAWLRQHESLDDREPALIRAKRAESRRRTLACLSAFARFLLKRGLIESNPLGLLPRAKPVRQAHERSEALTESEMQHLLVHVSERVLQARARPHDTPRSVRHLASLELSEVVIWTLLTVGMRVGELTKARIRDVREDGAGTRILLQSKGGGRHDPFVPPQTVQKIRNYLEKYRHNARPDEPLFMRVQRCAQRGPLTQFGVFKMVSEAAREIGIAKSISPHSLRATLATALIRQDVPVAHVRDLLGHQSIRTTSIYLKRVHAESEAATLKLDVTRLFGRDPEGSETS